MDKAEIDVWAKGFVADLRVGDEMVPLDRVLARHLDAFSELRAQGLTWSAIGAIIARAGARRANGRPISPDQLRANVARLLKRRTVGSAGTSRMPSRANTQAAVRSSSAPLPPTYRPPAVGQGKAPRPVAPVSKPTNLNPKEISKDDIAAALSRIKAK